MEDSKLLSQIINGDEIAMETFYRRHAGSVHAFAMRSLHNPVDATEVLNEVMMEVWRKASTFGGKSSVKTWLLKITHHKAVDAVRKNRRHDHDDETHIDQNAPNLQGQSLLDDALSNENAEQVSFCLEKLNDSQRQVVYLAFYEELSYPEIALTLTIPEGTVKTRMMHARKKLYECLQRLLNTIKP